MSHRPISGFPKFVVDGGRYFACTIYKNTPGAMVPNVGANLRRAFWDTICQPFPEEPQNPPLPGLPPAPAPPFTGGQCVCATYDVTYDLGYGSTVVFANRTIRVYGEILGIRAYLVSPPGDTTNAAMRYRLGYPGTCAATVTENVLAQSYGSNGQTPFATIKSVTRVGALPDNCGSLPASYPPATVPPGGYTSAPVTINFNDNSTTNVIYNFNPDTVLTPGKELPSLVVNVKGTGIDFPITYGFDESEIFGTPSAPITNLPPSVSAQIASTNAISQGLDFILNPGNYNQNPNVNVRTTPPTSGQEEDEEGLLGIRVKLNNLPNKMHFGEPNVYFAGWISFKLQDGYSPREQINFEESFFQAPSGARGYSVTFTNGATGIVKVYSKE